MVKKRRIFNNKLKREIPLYLMLIPAVVLIIIYKYLPMYGLRIAFQKFNPAIGIFGEQKFVGLDNFKIMFSNPYALRSFWNTVIIAFCKIITMLAVPIFFSLLINEVRNVNLKRTVQTLIYIPYFISWVVAAGMLNDILSTEGGSVNAVLGLIGIKPISFLGDSNWFRFTIISTNIWKEFGFGTVIYLAAITGIDPTLYEAAVVDGANRWKQTLHITLPGMRMIIVLMMVLKLGSVLNAGFDQIFNMYNPSVYATGDIIDTYTYRLGLINYQYGQAAAVGFFKSVVAFVFISSSYYIANKFFGYKVF